MPTENYAPDTHGALVAFDGLEGYEEVDRYWLNAPYAFASINLDTEADEYRYQVVEPDLDDLETALLDRLFDDIRDPHVVADAVAATVRPGGSVAGGMNATRRGRPGDHARPFRHGRVAWASRASAVTDERCGHRG